MEENLNELDQFLNDLTDRLADEGSSSPGVQALLQTAANDTQRLRLAETAVELRRAYETSKYGSGSQVAAPLPSHPAPRSGLKGGMRNLLAAVGGGLMVAAVSLGVFYRPEKELPDRPVAMESRPGAVATGPGKNAEDLHPLVTTAQVGELTLTAQALAAEIVKSKDFQHLVEKSLKPRIDQKALADQGASAVLRSPDFRKIAESALLAAATESFSADQIANQLLKSDKFTVLARTSIEKAVSHQVSRQDFREIVQKTVERATQPYRAYQLPESPGQPPVRGLPAPARPAERPPRPD